MADPTAANGQDALEEQLSRLLRKPGVRAIIVLDRGTGAIVKTSGQFEAIKALTSPQPATTSFTESEGASPEAESVGIGHFAAMIWTWVKTSETLIQDLDPEDEGRLLRLRTKKKELVVVPDAKYVLVVVHDTPPA